MSKCDLQIVLDRRNRTYAPGEKIAGVVEVRVNETCKCDGLTLSRRWRTYGKGNVATGDKLQLTLFKGTWEPGERISYGFEFEASSGPFSYSGTCVSVGWFLEARADVPWAIDPKAEEMIFIPPAPPVGPVRLGPQHSTTEEQYRSGRLWAGCGLIISVLLFLFGVFLVVGPTLLMRERGRYPTDKYPPIYVGLGFLLVGSLCLFFAMRSTIAQRKLGRVSVKFSAPNVAPGESVECTVRFTPKAALKVSEVTAFLSGKEWARRGSGKNSSNYSHTAHEHRSVLSSGLTTSPGREVQLSTRIAIPPTAPCTFEAYDNTVKWSVVVHINIEGWPDWKRTFPITVCP